ncbi:MAG: M23 family metallopeptidase [Microbacteriaceae bacterium]|nr:M23 family metallopeptidase [Microbacteriaceae bacterium]
MSFSSRALAPPASRTQRSLQATAIVLSIFVAFAGAAPVTGATAATESAAAWAWPVEAPHPIVRAFIAPETPYSAGHRGIDIDAELGSIVRTPSDGVIHFSGFVVNRNLISISHGGGLISSFEPVRSELAEGTVVHRGQPIGTLQSGHCRVPCLHLGARFHGQYISPLNFLGGIPRSVLLPTREIR